MRKYDVLFFDGKKAFRVRINDAINENDAVDKARKYLVNIKKRRQSYVDGLETKEIVKV